MNRIICAVRGGEPSRVVQQKAIQEARKRGTSLVFVFVVDVDSLGDVDAGLFEATRTELTWLGTSLLGLAKSRAQKQGVKAEVIILQGKVKAALIEFLQAHPGDLLLLGCPKVDANNSIFTQEGIHRFARDIEAATGKEVLLVSIT